MTPADNAVTLADDVKTPRSECIEVSSRLTEMPLSTTVVQTLPKTPKTGYYLLLNITLLILVLLSH